jgi:hypothetical protein
VLHLFLCDLNVAAVHSSMTIGALLGFLLHQIVYYLGIGKGNWTKNKGDLLFGNLNKITCYAICLLTR